jgi:hypothetical protein
MKISEKARALLQEVLGQSKQARVRVRVGSG